MLRLIIFWLTVLCVSAIAGPRNTTCPVMTSEDVDSEQMIEYEGERVYFCCQTCIKMWNRNPKYFIKVSGDLLPQFVGMEEKLKLKDVKLLAQRYCPIQTKNIVTPNSPNVEYEGKKIYFWDRKALEIWNRNPKECAKRATEAGLLPQLREVGK